MSGVRLVREGLIDFQPASHRELWMRDSVLVAWD